MSCKVITHEGIEYFDSIEVGRVHEVEKFKTLESGLQFIFDSVFDRKLDLDIPHIIVRMDGSKFRPLSPSENPLDEGTRLLLLRSWVDDAYADPELCAIDAYVFVHALDLEIIPDLDLIHDANGLVIPADIRFHRDGDLFVISANDLCKGFNLPLFDRASLNVSGYKANEHYVYLHFKTEDYTTRSLYFKTRGLAWFASQPGRSSIAIWLFKMISKRITSMKSW